MTVSIDRSRPRLRVANCSGFYGDRLAAAREMVEGGPIDVLTGDYLAELTLSILAKDRKRDPSLGYAKTFLLQLREIAAPCLERGIKIVVNAGGLNPAGCAEACRQIYRETGLDAKVAHIEGDDLLPRLEELRAGGEALAHLDHGRPLSDLQAPILGANAYLGAWGITAALERGADLVICPRVTDASLVVGPAAWSFEWGREDWNRLASAVVAGHVLECGAQATGGNYAFFREVQGLEHPGFPLVEIEESGDFTVTKHPGTGGEVSIGTVTAQLLYEIDSPRYWNPDVTARFDTIRLRSDGPDRVRVEGVVGEPPPKTTKVCLNHLGGFRNQVTFLLTGLDVEAKTELVEKTLWAQLGGAESFAETRVRLHRVEEREDPEAQEPPFSFLTVAVKDPNPKKVGRRFSGAAVEMALASYPGFNLTAPPGRETPVAVYWPTRVASGKVDHRLIIDGEVIPISPTLGVDSNPLPSIPGAEAMESGDAELAPLGTLCGARSGDKGGHANLGVWAISDEAYTWLEGFLTADRLRDLIPGARDLKIDRYPLPNLRSINFVLRSYLGDGVAASLATDAQAKGLGEFLRACKVPLPRDLLTDGEVQEH